MTELPRDTSGEWPPGTWRFVKRDGVPAANVKCPECGSPGGVGHDTNHAIAADGTVSPSLVCDDDRCNFHAFVKLAGWPEAVADDKRRRRLN